MVSTCSGVSRDKRLRRRILRVSGASLLRLSAQLGKHDENSVAVYLPAFNESALLHSRQLVGKTAFVPSHHPGQCLLAHFTFPDRGETYSPLPTPVATQDLKNFLGGLENELSLFIPCNYESG